MRSLLLIALLALELWVGGACAPGIRPARADDSWSFPFPQFSGIPGGLALPGSGCDATVASDCRGWKSTVFEGPEGKLPFSIYVPPGTPAGAPLVVMLHGCLGSARDFAVGSRMNFVADAEKFTVLYPEQTSQANSLRCWNWFRADGQSRGPGELTAIVGLIRRVQGEARADPARLYVVGMSAGAAMTSNLVNCYPEAIAGAAVHSGLPFGAARNENEATQVMRTGAGRPPLELAREGYRCAGARPGARPVVLALHGTEDSTVAPANGVAVMQEALELDDLLDDGITNDSVHKGVTRRTEYPSTGGKRPYRITEFGDGGRLGALLEVAGMKHAWSGGSSRGSYTDPEGPDATRIIWDFFRSHPALRAPSSRR